MPRYTVRGEEKYYWNADDLKETLIVIDNYLNRIVPPSQLGVDVIDHQPTLMHKPVHDMMNDEPICTFGYEFAEGQANLIVGQGRGGRTLVLIREMCNAELITENDAREKAGYSGRRDK